ncbi:MAG: PDGLE domain-containing protein [Leptolyngbyaceae bacterium]|nr:PDGLE domain-containing protein [Leptolyngbyaceae bacterium]
MMRDRFTLAGLGVAVLIAVFLSPLASQDPDGLDRVAQDLKFEEKAVEQAPAQQLPFYSVFDEYALRGVPDAVATPLAGLAGTLATFGLMWGLGKLLVRRSEPPTESTSPNLGVDQSDQPFK